MLLFLNFPWPWIGFVALLIPPFLRDAAYQLFARNRGKIWRKLKQITGMGDTMMQKYEPTILGLDEVPKPVPRNWGFAAEKDSGTGTKES